MAGDYVIFLLFGIGLIPGLVAGFLGSSTSVHKAAGVSLLVLIAIIALAPSEPHPYLGTLAAIMIPSVIVGWLAGYSATKWRQLTPEN